MPRVISPMNSVVSTRFVGAVAAHADAWAAAEADLAKSDVAVVVATHDGRAHAFVLSRDPAVHAGSVASRLAPPLLDGEGGGMPDRAHCAGPSERGVADGALEELGRAFERTVFELLRRDAEGLFHPGGCGSFEGENGEEAPADDMVLVLALADVRRSAR